MLKMLFDLPLLIYLAVLWLASQKGVFWFFFIAIIMLGVSVDSVSKDFNKWDRLCLINYLISLMEEKKPLSDWRVLRNLWPNLSVHRLGGVA